jgi:hypothetical protein
MIRPSSGHQQAIISPSSGHHQAIIRPIFKKIQEIKKIFSFVKRSAL